MSLTAEGRLEGVREGKRVINRETRRLCREDEILSLGNVVGFGKVKKLRNSNSKLMGIRNQWHVRMRDKYKLKMTLPFRVEGEREANTFEDKKCGRKGNFWQEIRSSDLYLLSRAFVLECNRKYISET